MGTSESPELGEVVVDECAPCFCSGDESVDESRLCVVELTLGEKAENGDCQFMASCVVSPDPEQWTMTV